MDNFELVDRDYSTASNSGRIHSNLIRLKPTSFEGIRNKWKNFRLARLNKKLEKAEAELENVANNVPFDQIEEKLLAKGKKIAKLEEKIKILSREEVPTNYVSNRAIKIKDSMMREILGISNEVYKNDNKAEDYGFSNFEDTNFNFAAATDINSENKKTENDDVKVETISSEDIRNAVNEKFEEVNENNKVADETISSEDIRNAVNEKFEEVNGNNKVSDETIENSSESSIDIPITIATDDEIENEYNRVSSNESTPVRTDKFDENGEVISQSTDTNENNYDNFDLADIFTSEAESSQTNDISENENDSSIDFDVENSTKSDEQVSDVTEAIEPSVDEFKISDNNEKFDPSKVENYGVGENYKKVSNIFDPMSDDELARARENIEYDKYEEQYENDNKVRDDIVVTPERKEDSTTKYDEYVVVEDDNNQDMHFDYSNATAKDIENAVNITSSSVDLKAMMARVAELKRKQAESKERMDEARRRKEEEARRAEESKRALEEKEKEKAAYMSKLNDYMEALKEDIEYNDNAASATDEETENIRQIIKEQEMKKVGFDKEINEINAVISPEAVNVRVVK